MDEETPIAPIPDIDDIAAPLPPAGHPWLPYVLVGAALLALAVVVFILVRRRRGGPVAQEYDARRAALDQLHALKDVYTRVPAREFALRVSHALRAYLAAFHDSAAPYQTSEELLGWLGGHAGRALPPDSLAELRAVLADCDLMQYSPSDEGSRLRLGVVEAAIHFIRADSDRRTSDADSPAS